MVGGGCKGLANVLRVLQFGIIFQGATRRSFPKRAPAGRERFCRHGGAVCRGGNKQDERLRRKKALFCRTGKVINKRRRALLKSVNNSTPVLKK